MVIAVCGAVAGWVSQPRSARAWLLTLLAAAIVLVPAEQASLHSLASLNKHGDQGAWFAAIAAGYAVERFIAAGAAPAACARSPRWAAWWRCAYPAPGRQQSRAFATQWPNSTAIVDILRPLVSNSSGRPAGGGPVDRRVLPADRQPVAAVVQHPEHRAARRQPDRRPERKAGVVGPGNAGTYAMYIKPRLLLATSR